MMPTWRIGLNCYFPLDIDMHHQPIQVWINQISTTLNQPAFLLNAIEASGVKPPFAAAVNMQFIPKKDYATHPLHTGDQIELIVPVTGG